MASHRILYVGADITLPARLTNALKPVECWVVRCPDSLYAHTFLESDIKYSLLLFDEKWADSELNFVRSLKHRRHTPVVVLKELTDLDSLVKTVKCALNF